VPHGRDFRLEFLAKLYFARVEGVAVASALIAAQIEASARRHDDLCGSAETLAAGQSFDWLVLRYRVGQLDATLAWLDLCAAWAASADLVPPDGVL
jgi:hypothetical protein